MFIDNFLRKIIEREIHLEDKISALNRLMSILLGAFFLIVVGLSFLISLKFYETNPIMFGIAVIFFIGCVLYFLKYVEFFHIFTVRGLFIISNFIVFFKKLPLHERIQFYSLFPTTYRQILFEMTEENELDLVTLMPIVKGD